MDRYLLSSKALDSKLRAISELRRLRLGPLPHQCNLKSPWIDSRAASHTKVLINTFVQ